MALVAEDGSGLPNAESYLSVAEATAYHAAMGNKAAWSALAGEATKEAALRQATSYIQGRYYGNWHGNPTKTTQKLDWPRAGVPFRNGGYVAANIIPDELKAACAELALRAASGPLVPDGTQTVKREKVGPLEVWYDPYTMPLNSYGTVDALLGPFLLQGSISGVSVPLRRS